MAHILSTLATDHHNVDALFKRFEQLDGDDRDELGHVRDLILEQLAIHAAIEEQTIYPALRAAGGDAALDTTVLEALEEHHATKLALAEIEKLDPGHERFRAKMAVVIDLIRHHVTEEESDDGIFGLARLHLAQPELEAMAEQAEVIRATGPTRPHPAAPDSPPWNVVLSLPVGIADTLVTAARRLVSGVFGAARPARSLLPGSR